MKNNGSKSSPLKTFLPKCPTGIQGLDEITGGGLPRGRPTLVCGGAGCGKTLLAAEFLVLFFSFEESPDQIIRNLHSIGLRLEPLVKRGRLRFHSARPSLCGLEMHLAVMFKEITTFKPQVVIIDPITRLRSDYESETMALRRMDEPVGISTLMLTGERTASGILRQADARSRSMPAAAPEKER